MPHGLVNGQVKTGHHHGDMGQLHKVGQDEMSARGENRKGGYEKGRVKSGGVL